MATQDFSKQPVSSVRWVHRDTLTANDYNPNFVAPPELDLLEISIAEDGWTQPIVMLENGQIVDGFHRYLVSGRKQIHDMTNGFVPVVIISADAVHQKMSTIRHNRARGTHAVVKMADIVQSMVESGVPADEIARRLGMEDEEVVRLANRNGIPISMLGKEFGQSWRPKE